MNFDEFAPLLRHAIRHRDLSGLQADTRSLGEKALAALLNDTGWSDYAQPPMLQAVDTADAGLVAALLSMGANLEQQDGEGRTPLYRALVRGDLALAHWLVGQGANLHASTRSGIRVLDVALSAGDRELVDTLITMGSSLEHSDDRGITTLHRAAASSDLALVELVLAQTGWTADSLDQQGRLPQDFCRDLGIFEYLLARSSDPVRNRIFADGDSSLHVFARRGAGEIVASLLQQGIDVNLPGARKDTALHHAAGNNDLPMVQLLLTHGANPNARNRYNFRPLHWACEAGADLVLIELLLAHKAKVNVQTNQTGFTHLTRTPLYLAVAGGHHLQAAYLLEQGADPNMRNDSGGATALTEACRLGQRELVERLLAHGASPNGLMVEGVARHFPFPLAEAADADIVDLLVAAGADVDACNQHGQSALYWQAKYIEDDAPRTPVGAAKLGAIAALLKHGADVNQTCQFGQSAFSLVRCPAASQLLLQATLGLRADATLDIAPQVRTTAGPALCELARDIDTFHGFDALLDGIQTATGDAVRYRSEVPLDGEATALHLVLESAHACTSRSDRPNLAQFGTAIGMLLDKGANPSAIGTLAQTSPLHLAAGISMARNMVEHLEALKTMLGLLLDAGADIQGRNLASSTPLDYAGHPEIYTLLTARGALHGEANQVMYDLVAEGETAAAEWMIAQRVGLGSRGYMGETLLMAATHYDREALLQLLLTQGASAGDTRRDGRTVLHVACEHAAFACLPLLLQLADLDLNHQDAKGDTALGLLLRYECQSFDIDRARQQQRLADALAIDMVQRGARLDLPNTAGKIPLESARTKTLQSALNKAAKGK